MLATVVLSAIVMLLLDMLWISTNKHRYASLVSGVQRSPMRVKLLPALIAYVAMVVSLYLIVLPLANNTQGSIMWRALMSGGLFGLVLYGVFNATNMAIFSNYNIHVAILDTLWGTCLFFVVTLFALCVKPYKNFLFV
jgi:uncharacterized membrane protein